MEIPTQSSASIIQKNVMRRVRIIRTARAILTTELAAFFVLVLALYGVGREVWVARVFQNMPAIENTAAFSRFWFDAILDTRAVVQILLALVAIAAVYLIGETAKLVRTVPMFARA